MRYFAYYLQDLKFERGDRVRGYDCYTKPAFIFKSNDVKITAGNTRKGLGLDIPGIICVDTRTLLMKD
jgi:hypothetical protein